MTLIYIISAYVAIGALYGGGSALYGLSQGQRPTWSGFGRSVVLWLPDAVRTVVAKVRGA